MPDLPAAVLSRALAHLLAGQPWLQEKLVPFAGRRARIEVFPFAAGLEIGADGALSPSARSAEESDAHVSLSPLAAMRLLAGDADARRQVEVRGDAALAGALQSVFRELRWDVEEDLSRLVGDVAAHRIVGGGRDLAAWQRRSARDLMQGSAEYLVEERRLLASPEQVRAWSRAVDTLRDDLERLAKRIDRLSEED
ncbi:MAG: sterol-binding protein [Burkholderiales bacterium]|nr:sterol-binding protein [Burkholderiales bacterium]